jgi:hypothetical protein
VLIEFADDDDYNAFKSYLEEVRNQEGSASPLRNGLMSSALRRAKIGGVR